MHVCMLVYHLSLCKQGKETPTGSRIARVMAGVHAFVFTEMLLGCAQSVLVIHFAHCPT